MLTISIKHVNFIGSQNAIGEILEAIIEFGAEWMNAWLHQAVHQELELFFCEVQVKAIL